MKHNEKDALSSGSSEHERPLDQKETENSRNLYDVDTQASTLNAVFQNPLAGVPRDQLMADVEEFCQRFGLMDHIDSFRKGALVSQVCPELYLHHLIAYTISSISMRINVSLSRMITYMREFSCPSRLSSFRSSLPRIRTFLSGSTPTSGLRPSPFTGWLACAPWLPPSREWMRPQTTVLSPFTRRL